MDDQEHIDRALRARRAGKVPPGLSDLNEAVNKATPPHDQRTSDKQKEEYQQALIKLGKALGKDGT